MKCITFFAGAGGLDMGLHQAGFDMCMSLELVEKYCNTLKINHPTWNVVQGDIMDLDREKVLNAARIQKDEEIFLIAGGSPCQSFSTNGLRKSFSDPRGMAMIKYIELIEELQPKMFLLENVKGLLSAALIHRPLAERGANYPPLTNEELPGSALSFLLSKIHSYKVKIKTINAADYGVAQKRERVFIIGVRNDIDREFQFPEPTHMEIKNNKNEDEQVAMDTLLPRWRTIRDVFKELNVEHHHHVNYSADRLKYMKMIPKNGGNWRDLPGDVQPIAMGGAYKSGGGKVGFFRRLKIDEPSPTLVTTPHQKSTNLGHPTEDRPLSLEEYLAIQGFPVNYVLEGSLTDKYTQIGNAVPVHLAYVLGRSIYNFLEQI